MWTAPVWDQSVSGFQWAVAICASLTGAVFDMNTKRIPNLLTGPVLIAGLAWGAWSGGAAGFANASAGCLLLGLPYVLLFSLAGGGAGDAKLMGAIGAWLGVMNGAIALAAVSIFGAIYAVGYAAAKKELPTALKHLRQMVLAVWLIVRRQGSANEAKQLLPEKHELIAMPYGVAVFGGVCLAAGGILLWGV